MAPSPRCTSDYIHRMSFTFSTKICFITVLCTVPVVLAAVPEPQNVRVTSLNLGVVLDWDAPRDSPANLTYTAQYRSTVDFVSVCRSLSEESCDFTEQLSNFGIYVFRVRAEHGEETSLWVETLEFSRDKDTLIGAPTLRLSSRQGNMELHLKEPVVKIPGNLREVYSSVCFNIRYWEENVIEKTDVLNCEQQNRLVLSGLKPSIRYCMQAQVFVPNYRKSGEFSEVVCETNTVDGKVQPWVIAVAMVGSLLSVAGAVTLLFLIGWYGYKGLKFMFPTVKLPERFKQCLIETPQAYILPASQPVEQCHELRIISELAEGEERGEESPLQPP